MFVNSDLRLQYASSSATLAVPMEGSDGGGQTTAVTLSGDTGGSVAVRKSTEGTFVKPDDVSEEGYGRFAGGRRVEGNRQGGGTVDRCWHVQVILEYRPTGADAKSATLKLRAPHEGVVKFAAKVSLRSATVYLSSFSHAMATRVQ